ncbi:oligosaccharide flippase family protein, partial [Enterococcus faecium]|nr:oligosaccharide flippase family protein [Enterococcus faecium]
MLLKNKTVKNSLYSALYQVLILFVPLATTPYITRIFTAEQLGVYASSLALVSFFVVLASFGLPLYGSREIAKSSGNNRKLRFVQFFLFQIVTSIISFILFIILIRVAGANKYYYYQSLLIIVNIFDVSWFFIGIEEIKRTLLRNFFSKIFTLITIFIFVKTSSDLDIYIFLNILGMFIGNISMIIQLKKFLSQPFNLVFLDYKSIKECFNLFIPQILSNSKNTFDRLILLTLTGNNSFVGLYDQGRKLINIIIAVSNSATTAVLPKMTSLKAQNETKKFEMIIHKVLPILVLFSVFATTGLIINADLFVSIFFGSSFTDVSQVLKYLSLSLLVIPLNFFLYNAILLPSSEDKIYRNILT